MALQDKKQITVDGNQVGIIGLQEVLEQRAKEYPQVPDHKIQSVSSPPRPWLLTGM